jgi:hypothetical protein
MEDWGTIEKFPVYSNIVFMPKGAKIITGRVNSEGTLFLWAIVNNMQELEEKNIIVVGDNITVGGLNSAKYLCSHINGEETLHIFESQRRKEASKP